MMQQYRSNSYLFGGNAPYVEEMYEAYLDNPGSVPDNWREYFDALQNVPAVDGTASRDVPHAPVIESFAQRAKSNAFTVKASSTDLAVARKQVHVQSLIAAYRFLGSRWADLDPLKRTERPKIPELEPAFYDLSESDMDIPFSAANTYFSRAEHMTLREIMQALRETYCGTVGAEFMHCTDPTEKRWWQERLESARSKPSFTPEKRKHILDRLTAAEGLERYLHTKYVGQKRFSLEGGESFIASMDAVVQGAGARGAQDCNARPGAEPLDKPLPGASGGNQRLEVVEQRLGDMNGRHGGLCLQSDKPIAGLLTDLQRRGLLKDTLVIWGGEFGRTPMSEKGNGRDHNPHGFCHWLAGAGIKGGVVHGVWVEIRPGFTLRICSRDTLR